MAVLQRMMRWPRGLRNAREKPAGAWIRCSSRIENEPRRRRCVPGTGPFRSASAAWPLSRTRRFGLARTECLRSGRGAYLVLPEWPTPGAGEMLFSSLRLVCGSVLLLGKAFGLRRRNLRRRGLRYCLRLRKVPFHRCLLVRRRNRFLVARSVEIRPFARILPATGIPAFAPTLCSGPDDSRTRSNRREFRECAHSQKLSRIRENFFRWQQPPNSSSNALERGTCRGVKPHPQFCRET